MKPIPQEWIRKYVDELINAAKLFGDTAMGKSAAERASHILDMVEAFRSKDAKDKRGEA